MSPILYTEDSLVQQTTAEYLERELGWESVYAYNQEAVLTRYLYLKLIEFNPGLPDDDYREAVRRILEYGARCPAC